MKIRLLCDRAGFGFTDWEGDLIDLPSDEARRLIAAGQAELVQPEVQREVATVGAAENASLKFVNQNHPKRRK